MFRKLDLSVVFTPPQPRAGELLRVRAELVGLKPVHIRAVRWTLQGFETVTVGDGKKAHKHRSMLVNMTSKSQAFTLGAAERRALETSFDLSEALRPSYSMGRASIRYTLETQVDIARWFNHTVEGEVRVRAPLQRLVFTPSSLTNLPDGPRGTELNLDVALESTTVAVGGEVRGMVALQNARHHRIDQLELSLIATDTGKAAAGSTVDVHHVHEKVVIERVADDVPYPFEIKVPDWVVPNFRGVALAHAWRLEARARVMRFRKDPVVTVPLTLIDAVDRPGSSIELPPMMTPVGEARKRQTWAKVAETLKLDLAPTGDELRQTVGAVTAIIRIELVSSEYWLVASLTWPTLGIALSVTERSWRDVVFSEPPIDAPWPAFEKRLALRGREPAQVKGLFDQRLSDDVMGFDQVQLADESGRVSVRGNGRNERDLERFARRVSLLAEHLDDAFGRLLPPSALAPHLEAWEAAAEKFGGRLEVGSLSVRAVTFRNHQVELVHRDGQGPFARVLFIRAKREPIVLPVEAQRIALSVAAECSAFRIAPDGVEATNTLLRADPSKAELLWKALIRVADALETPSDVVR